MTAATVHPMADSLADFAAASAPARKCAVCALPRQLIEQVDAAPGAGISYSTVSNWLKNLGHSVTRHQLGRHRSGACQ